MLITVVLIACAYYFASKIRLYYESYLLLESLERDLGIVTIGINALEIKYGKNKSQQHKGWQKVIMLKFAVC